MGLKKAEPRDRVLGEDLASRLLDAEVLEMYDRKSAPKCPGPTGIHSAKVGRKSEVALVRKDGRLLAMTCRVCLPSVAIIYGADPAQFEEEEAS